MISASFKSRLLRFAFTARTSREVFHEKLTYIVRITNGTTTGVGEVAVFPSLQPSYSTREAFESQLSEVCADINDYINGRPLPENSAIRFGIETALGDMANGGKMHPFGGNLWNSGQRPFLINGLIWMNPVDVMIRQIDDKLNQGFKCLKLKIGANDFEKELNLLESIRSTFASDRLELRLDANGCFTSDNVLECLDRLAKYEIHSIEQPLIRDSSFMKETIEKSPISIVLDEDMIERWWNFEQKGEWLANLNPAYIILKPSLVGGFETADEWAEIAGRLGIGWWATSALESNIGLNAIAQWLASRGDAMSVRHGLGTGQIYLNNIVSPIYLDGECLYYNPGGRWEGL